MAHVFAARNFTVQLAKVLGLSSRPIREIVLRSNYKDVVTVDVSMCLENEQAAGILEVIERYKLSEAPDGR